MRKAVLFLFIYLLLTLNAYAESILLIRGLDQIIFRGMDVLGAELHRYGYNVVVSSPIAAMEDFNNYDVVIGNSQGAVVAMNRKQKIKPRLVVTIDIPYHPNWTAKTGIKHLNIHGPGWGKVKGARNIFIPRGHLALSFDAGMKKIVVNNIMVW